MISEDLLFLGLSTTCTNELDFSVFDLLQDSVELAQRQRSLDSFIRGEIDLEQYLELLDQHCIDIDDYLLKAEEFLEWFGLL